MEPAFVLQDLVQSRLAGSRGDSVEGELEQGAGEGSLRRNSDDAAPARHVGRTQSRPNGRMRTCSSRSRKEPQKGGGLGTPAATNLNFFFFLAPFCVRVGSPHAGSGVPTRAGYASQLGPVRRLPAGNSPNGTSWSSDGSLGPVTGSSRSEQACARSAANAAWAFQRWFRACAPRCPLASPCPREQSQERQGAAADSPANFHADDNQAAARACRSSE